MTDLSVGTAVAPQDTNNTAAATTATQDGQTQPQNKKGTFSRVLGNVLGGAINVMAPAAGGVLGTLIRGGGLGYTAEIERMMAESTHQQMQLIGVQMRVQERSEQFATVSNLMKSRHDGEMEAIRNFKA
jgi:hypothetical protein